MLRDRFVFSATSHLRLLPAFVRLVSIFLSLFIVHLPLCILGPKDPLSPPLILAH